MLAVILIVDTNMADSRQLAPRIIPPAYYFIFSAWCGNASFLQAV
jgi:hypothetical protein